MIRNLIFDLGGVVFDENDGATTSPLRMAAKDDGQYHMLWSNLLLGRMKMKECSQILIEQNPANEKLLAGADTYDFYLKNLPPITETVDFIREVSEIYNIYVLSNATDAMRDYAVKYLKIPSGIRGIFSCDVNLMKPDLEIFRLAINHFKLDPQETMYFDDKAKNCVAAEFLGMKSVLVKNPNDVIRAIKKF